MSARLRSVEAPEVSREPRPRKLRERVTATVPIAPVAFTDLTAPHVVGLEPRHLREFVVRNDVPFVRAGQRVIVKVSDFVAALDRLAAEQHPKGVTAAAPINEIEFSEDEDVGDRLLRRLGWALESKGGPR